MGKMKRKRTYQEESLLDYPILIMGCAILVGLLAGIALVLAWGVNIVSDLQPHADHITVAVLFIILASAVATLCHETWKQWR